MPSAFKIKIKRSSYNQITNENLRIGMTWLKKNSLIWKIKLKMRNWFFIQMNLMKFSRSRMWIVKRSFLIAIFFFKISPSKFMTQKKKNFSLIFKSNWSKHRSRSCAENLKLKPKSKLIYFSLMNFWPQTKMQLP